MSFSAPVAVPSEADFETLAGMVVSQDAAIADLRAAVAALTAIATSITVGPTIAAGGTIASGGTVDSGGTVSAGGTVTAGGTIDSGGTVVASGSVVAVPDVLTQYGSLLAAPLAAVVPTATLIPSTLTIGANIPTAPTVLPRAAIASQSTGTFPVPPIAAFAQADYSKSPFPWPDGTTLKAIINSGVVSVAATDPQGNPIAYPPGVNPYLKDALGTVIEFDSIVNTNTAVGYAGVPNQVAVLYNGVAVWAGTTITVSNGGTAYSSAGNGRWDLVGDFKNVSALPAPIPATPLLSVDPSVRGNNPLDPTTSRDYSQQILVRGTVYGAPVLCEGKTFALDPVSHFPMQDGTIIPQFQAKNVLITGIQVRQGCMVEGMLFHENGQQAVDVYGHGVASGYLEHMDPGFLADGAGDYSSIVQVPALPPAPPAGYWGAASASADIAPGVDPSPIIKGLAPKSTVNFLAGVHNIALAVNHPMTINFLPGASLVAPATGINGFNAHGGLVLNLPSASDEMIVNGGVFVGWGWYPKGGGSGLIGGIRVNTPGAYQFNNNVFLQCQNGIGVAPCGQANIRINNLIGVNCGNGADGGAHTIYVGEVARLAVNGYISYAPYGGHDLKSRAAISAVDGRWLNASGNPTDNWGFASAADSGNFDFPDGGQVNCGYFNVFKPAKSSNMMLAGSGNERRTMNPWGAMFHHMNFVVDPNNPFANFYTGHGQTLVFDPTCTYAPVAGMKWKKLFFPDGQIIGTPAG